MVGPNQAVVIASSQHRRQSLAALLRSMPEFGEIYEAESVSRVQPSPSLTPVLIIFDCWQGEDFSQEIVDSLKQSFKKARFLALVRQNNEVFHEAGIDLVLVEGFAANDFYDAIRRLISQDKSY